MLPKEYNNANLKGLPATALKNDPNDIIWIKYPWYKNNLPMTQHAAKPNNL